MRVFLYPRMKTVNEHVVIGVVVVEDDDEGDDDEGEDDEGEDDDGAEN